MEQIKMVDLSGQYLRLKDQIDEAVLATMEEAAFINGPQVKAFETELAAFLGVKHVIPCANGTDALQIALMSLDLEPGSEVIVPSFTYVATAEVVGLLKLTPVLVDVDPASFNTTVKNIEKAITSRTRAIVPVHLFGQGCDLEPILQVARRCNAKVIEDNAQSLGARYLAGEAPRFYGTIGDIGCLSFFPTKNLGCYGDGGALLTNDDKLAVKIRMIANHGQEKKYHHKIIGCNSRLDSLQAAVLRVKLQHVEAHNQSRITAARIYTEGLSGIDGLVTPTASAHSTHVYHQYTIKLTNGKRDALKQYLSDQGIPTMIYYPVPLQEQEAFRFIARTGDSPEISKQLTECVLSLPMHTELSLEQQTYIIEKIRHFFA